MMVQLFVKQEDEEKCQAAKAGVQHQSLTGLSMSGKIQTVSGRVMSVLPTQAVYPDYPLIVTIDEKK